MNTGLNWLAFACVGAACAPAAAQQFSVAAFRDAARTNEVRTEKLADGNHVLGPDGTRLVAHENSRRMLAERNVLEFGDSRLERAAYLRAALPIIAFDDRMQPLIAGGATLEQVLAAKITAEWDAQRGNPTTFISGSYASLTR